MWNLYFYINLTMQVVIWIVIILVAIFLIWLLKRWIKRLIFILILLALAFFIYWIFSPSWAARLWYNVRTFPQRVASWISSGSEFLDYDSYKLDVSSIWDKIWDKIGLWDGEAEIEDLDSSTEISDKSETIEVDTKIDSEKQEIKSEEYKNEETSQDEGIQTIKSFPKSVDFVEVPNIGKETRSENFWPFEWRSKVDLLWIINKYIEKNLDDDTDILVTVEYEEGNKNPQKIILQTQPKTKRSASNSNRVVEKSSHWSNSEKVEINSDEKVSNNQVTTNSQTVKKTTSTKLTQKDQRDAEEIFSTLF